MNVGVHTTVQRRESLLSQRMDLRTLIDFMETDKSLDVPSWQLHSVKEQLRDIEDQISRFRALKYRHRYEHR